jgi:hypothetical protein
MKRVAATALRAMAVLHAEASEFTVVTIEPAQ